jgi:hypothetical protein
MFSTFSIMVFSQLMNAQMGFLTEALADKRDVAKCVGGGIGAAAAVYFVFALTVGIYFGDAVDGSCNINWAKYRFLPVRLAVVSFPALDVFSVFPANVAIAADNLMAVAYSDTNPIPAKSITPVEGGSEISCVTRNARLDVALANPWARAAWRIAVVIPSVLLALRWWVLDRILAFTGVIGMLVAFVLPAFLYPLAHARCEMAFGSIAPLVRRPLFLPHALTRAPFLLSLLAFGVLTTATALLNTFIVDFHRR